MRPQLQDDDAQQYQDILRRLNRLEQGGKTFIGPYTVSSGDLAPGAYSTSIAPVDPGFSDPLPDFSTLTNFMVIADKVDVAWGLEVQFQRNSEGHAFTFWNAGSHTASCTLFVVAMLY